MDYNIIDALYRSNLTSVLKLKDQTISPDQLVAEIQSCYEKLQQRMDGDTFAIFKCYDYLHNLLDDTQEEQCFVEGFQTGAKLILSILTDRKK